MADKKIHIVTKGEAKELSSRPEFISYNYLIDFFFGKQHGICSYCGGERFEDLQCWSCGAPIEEAHRPIGAIGGERLYLWAD